MKYYVMCVDDDEDFLASLAGPLKQALEQLGGGYECERVFLSSGAAAKDFAETIAKDGAYFALVITDQRMPGMTGLELLKQLRDRFPDAATVLLTGYAGLESARTAINEHLLDRYISKPITDLTEFSGVVTGLVNEFHLQRITRQQQQALEQKIRELEEANERISRTKRAAEQVAYFTQGLGTVDLDEIRYQTVSRIPQLFGASHGVLVEFDEAGKLHMLRRFGNACRKSCSCVQSLGETMRELTQNNQPCMIRQFADHPASGCGSGGFLQIVIPVYRPSENLREDGSDRDGQESSPERRSLAEASGDIRPSVLCVCSPQAGDFEQQVEEIRYKAALIRDIIGTNMAHAAAYAESQRQSSYDSMTGLLIRRVFDDRLIQACQESGRYGRPVSVAILDVDNFKQINDTFGHLTGDLVLEEVGQLVRRNLRSCDVGARYGGDELAILLPGTPLSGAERLVERIRRQVAEYVFPYEHLRITCSIGVACYDQRLDAEWRSVVRRADMAMYQAKDSGRNAVSSSLGVGGQAEEGTLARV